LLALLSTDDLLKEECVQISPNVRSIINQDGGILLDIEHGTMISLNVSASQIWKKLQLNIPPDQIAREISVEFQISTETARHDVQEFIDNLQKHELLKVDPRNRFCA
jgi:hypothetical protein